MLQLPVHGAHITDTILSVLSVRKMSIGDTLGPCTALEGGCLMSLCTAAGARWVAIECCRPFDVALARPAAGDAAGPEGVAAADGGRRSQALKLAVQLHRCGQEVLVQI